MLAQQNARKHVKPDNLNDDGLDGEVFVHILGVPKTCLSIGHTLGRSGEMSNA